MSSPSSYVNLTSALSYKIHSKIVRAGAGAGKTTRLTENIYLTARNFYGVYKKWPNLVVTTFTKKATKELRERLVIKACSENDFEFLEYLNGTNKIHISTIHGVLNQFFRNYGHLMGWDNSFQIMSKNEINKFVKAVVKDLDGQPEWENILNQFTYTELISLLLSYVDVKLSHPEARFANFDKLKEIQTHYLNQQKVKLKGLASFIYESFTQEKWLDYAKKIEVAPIESLLDYLSSIGSRPRKTKNDDEESIQHVSQTLEDLKKSLSKSGLQDCDIERAESIYTSFEIVADSFLSHFLQRKQKLAKIELRDLELLTLKIIREEPNLAKAFSGEWDYWLIDEYQDTSPLQESLLQHLIGDRPVYVVGDPQQSIYLFRGARSEVFAQKEAQLFACSETLVKNYRSRPEVLAFINDIFSGFEQKFLSMDYGDKFGQAEKNYCAAEFHEGNEDAFVAKKIIELLNKKVSPEKICILSRKNKSLLKMARALSLYQIPTHVHASSGFYSRREVLDIIFLVRFLANPHDNENFVGLLRTPWVGIRDEKLITLAREWNSKSGSLWSHSLQQNLGFVETLQEIMNLSESHGIFYAAEHFLITSGMVDYSHYQDSTGRKESNIWKFMVSWQEQEKKPGFNILSFLNQSEVDLSDSEGTSEADAVAALEPNSVNLMTIHASKGLQFDYVFVIDCGSSPIRKGGNSENQKIHYLESEKCWGFAIPNKDGTGREKTLVDHLFIEEMQKRELEESDRLFYVALTRAIQKIHLSWKGTFTEDSWLARSHFHFEPGEYQQNGYAYKMTQGEIEVSDNWQVSKAILETLSDLPLQTTETPIYLNKISVTRFLEKQEKQIKIQKIAEASNDRVGDSTLTSNVALNKIIGPKTDKRLNLQEDLYVPGQEEIRNPQQLLKFSQMAKLGTDFHKLFELYRYNPSLDVHAYLINNFMQKEVPVLLKAFDWVINLETPPMRELLKTGFVEWGFQKLSRSFSQSTTENLSENLIVEGQIDLWGEVDGVTWLIDYKSGSSQYKEKAIKQLDIYAGALSEIGKENIRKAIIYPLASKVFFF